MFIVVDCRQDNTTKETDEGGEGINAIRKDMLCTNYFSPARCSFCSHRLCYRSSLFLVYWAHLAHLAAIAMTRVGERRKREGRGDGWNGPLVSLPCSVLLLVLLLAEEKRGVKGVWCLCVRISLSLTLALSACALHTRREKEKKNPSIDRN